MIGIQLPETVNYFVAKLGNIPDIPCVLPAWTQVRSGSRSGSFAPRIWLSQEPVYSTRTYSEVP